MAVHRRKLKAWGGFVGGRLEVIDVDDGWGGWGHNRRRALAIFTNRQEARHQFRDVRRVEIHIVHPSQTGAIND